MKNTRKLIGIMLALSMLFACSSGVAFAESTEAKFPISDELITLSFFVETSNADLNDFYTRMESNEMLKYIEEKTNIRLELIPLQSNTEAKQKIILALASGTYPDGAMLSNTTKFTRADLMQYGMSEGYLLPLEDYIDEYGVEINKIFNTHSDMRASMTAPDGHIYAIPRFSECYHCSAYPKLWFNYQWLENLGLEAPTTIQELYDVLLAFKEQDANGNGDPNDEIPMTASIAYSCAVEYYLMNSFMDCPAFNSVASPRMFLHWNGEAGQVEFLANKDEYREGLEWIKKFYDDGLIDPAAFTQDLDGLRQQCRTEIPTVGCYVGEHLANGIDFSPENVDIIKQYHAIAPMEGPNGVRYQPYNSYENQVTSFSFVLFDTCAYPAEAYQLADWFLSQEMTISLGWNGLEAGGGWTKNTDETKLDIIGNPMYGILNTSFTTEEAEIWNAPLMPYADTYEVRCSILAQPSEEMIYSNFEVYLYVETDKTDEYFPEICLPRDMFMDLEASVEFNELRLTINSYVQQNTAMFITGARSLDEWDSYCSELAQLNIDRYVELYRDAYQVYLD